MVEAVEMRTWSEAIRGLSSPNRQLNYTQTMFKSRDLKTCSKCAFQSLP